MHVVVVAEARFVGLTLVEELAEAGHRVDVLTPDRAERFDPRARARLGSRGDLGSILEDAPGIEAVVDVDAATRQDAVGIVEAVAGRPVRLVALSSIDVYRAFEALLNGRVTEAVPLSESSPLREPVAPLEAAGRHRIGLEHLAIEEVYRESGLVYTLLRVPVVYGPGDDRRREWPWIRRVLDERRVLPMGAGWMGWTISRIYVWDLASAVRSCVEQPQACAREVFNVSQSQCLPWAALARAVSIVAGADIDVVPVPEDELPPHLHPGPYAPQPLLIDSGRIRARLGWSEASPWDERLARTVRWHLDHPPELEDEEDLPDYAAEDRLLERHRPEPRREDP